ncbi:hypothetical protein J1605_018202 [Eschrichtius robustus]|uniref:Tetratricopeptide repeat protein 6 n=1 Tax=Eschrichtius robustus TaxID=9764 RepID=A0AB34I0B3_ESCRO|nr:hypothetical protein J1605_018202 [Eschrichtius robustus]
MINFPFLLGLIELSPIQQALIYSFCENHDKAIQVLDGITSNKPEVTMYALLAKAQMKAKRNKEAMRMFKKALDIFSHSDKGRNAVAASSDCLYHLGLCYMEEGNLQLVFCIFKSIATIYLGRTDAFTKISVPAFFLSFSEKAYLSRVAYYGLKGRYSKAILSCNEAIKIYPQSVRAYIYRGVLKYYNKVRQFPTLFSDEDMRLETHPRHTGNRDLYRCSQALTDYGIVLLLDAGETVTLNAFINRGLIYTELEQFSFALELVLRHEIGDKYYSQMLNTHTIILQINTRAEFLTNRGVIHEFMGQQQNAMRDYQAAISLNPTYSLAYFNAGNIYFHHRQFSQVM